jgi:hypothetical protein
VEKLDWVAIDHIRFVIPWPKDVTADLPMQTTSMAAARRQNLLVSWRADAEAEMSRLKAPDERASAAFRRGGYRIAYEQACQDGRF